MFRIALSVDVTLALLESFPWLILIFVVGNLNVRRCNYSKRLCKSLQSSYVNNVRCNLLNIKMTIMKIYYIMFILRRYWTLLIICVAAFSLNNYFNVSGNGSIPIFHNFHRTLQDYVGSSKDHFL